VGSLKWGRARVGAVTFILLGALAGAVSVHATSTPDSTVESPTQLGPHDPNHVLVRLKSQTVDRPLFYMSLGMDLVNTISLGIDVVRVVSVTNALATLSSRPEVDIATGSLRPNVSRGGKRET
jgi:hypothetical protein